MFKERPIDYIKGKQTLGLEDLMRFNGISEPLINKAKILYFSHFRDYK